MSAAEPQRATLRPWYRSALVWLALFPFFFLLWAWRESMHTTGRGVMWVRPGQSFYLSHGAGSLRFGEDDATMKSPMGWSTWEWSLDDPDVMPLVWCPPPALEREEEDSRTTLKLPHWLMGGLYLAIWIGGIRWRSHRMRRALTLPAEP